MNFFPFYCIHFPNKNLLYGALLCLALLQLRTLQVRTMSSALAKLQSGVCFQALRRWTAVSHAAQMADRTHREDELKASMADAQKTVVDAEARVQELMRVSATKHYEHLQELAAVSTQHTLDLALAAKTLAETTGAYEKKLDDLSQATAVAQQQAQQREADLQHRLTKTEEDLLAGFEARDREITRLKLLTCESHITGEMVGTLEQGGGADNILCSE
jgi:hypothetical protein